MIAPANWASSLLGCIALGVALAPAATAAPCVAAASQDELDIRVLVVRGNVVEIDRGASSGVEVGDQVVLRPIGGAEVQGSIRDVTAEASVVVLSGAAAGLAPGVPGIVRLPEGRLAAPEAGEGPDGMPPVVWTNPEDAWADDVPLLAEVTGPRPDERPRELHGRATLGGYLLSDSGSLPRSDSVGRLGLDLDGSNPFGNGGRMEAGLELRSERTDYDDPGLEDDSDSYLRVDRLSYTVGGTREEPWRFQGGRFLSRAFPELGFLDGVETSYRTESGRRFGGSLGFQPALDRERSFEDAPTIALWALLPFAEENRGELGVALQKSWFEGSEDRDLAIVRGRWTDGEAWRAEGSVWMDLYGSGDAGRSGLELTEARASVTRTIGSRAGVRVDASHVEFPIVRRLSSQEITEDRLFDVDNDTLSLSGWMPVGDKSKLTGRVGTWSSADDDGGWVDVGFERRLDGTRLDRWSIGVFASDDPRNDVLGVRSRVSGPGAGGRWSLGLDLGQYDRVDGTTTENTLQGALRAGWNGRIAEDWYLYFDATSRFGDDQDSYGVDFTLQRSF